MPRAGGESGKLGDRYEAVWTVDSLLDVLVGDALSIIVEPFESSESLGIEFKKEVDAGSEFHSAKRQTTGQLWSLADLMRICSNGRSVLGDLFSKLELFPDSRVVFVSGTTARDLEELCGAAADSPDAATFEKRLNTMSRELRKKFEDQLLRPQFQGGLSNAWQMMRCVRVVGWTENEMIRRIEQRIRAILYSTNGNTLDATSVRYVLAEMTLGMFGQKIRRQQIVECLAEHGVAERDWARERGPRELVEKRNAAYVKHVEAELLAGERIARDEAVQAAKALVQDGKKRAAFIGAAGFGKSCAMAQTLVHLQREGIPTLALRLDIQTEVLTSRRLGEELGLPESPVIVLAGIANGRRCVLSLDQLDAISFASGRNQKLWDVFEEMLREAERYPQMRVLLACRAFDAEHDPRLRRLLDNGVDTVRIELGKLPPETVSRLVRDNVGVDPATLDAGHLDLLRTPLHLSLYLQGDPRQQPYFVGVQELLGRYWVRKRQLVTQQIGRESRWFEVIKCLVDRLSRDQTLSAPRTLLDPFDNVEIGALASLNVIVLDGNSVRFYHEAFFDYCCARLFAEQGRTLLEFLLEGGREQHLFRRAQVRQILDYQREPSPETYLRDLCGLLVDSRIRYHLKKLAIDWLSGLAAPSEDEWRLIESLDPTTQIGFMARRVAWGRPAWVKLLERLNIWKQWLESPDVETVHLAVRILSLPDVMKVCSVETAKLFRPYLEGQTSWREEFSGLFFFGEYYHSREMFELFRDAMRLRLITVPKSNDWSLYDTLAKLRPHYAVELLVIMLAREGDAAEGEQDDEELGEEPAENFVVETARGAPEAFSAEIIPRVINALISCHPGRVHNGSYRWHRRRKRFAGHNTATILEKGLEVALGILAKKNPEVLDSITAPLEVVTHETASMLLLSAWMENGAHFADRIVCYLLQDPSRLNLNCFMWSDYTGVAVISRAAVRSASPHCSSANYRNLEAAILAFTTEREREDPSCLGHQRMLLLECLPSARISQEAQLHFNELKLKIPWERFEMASPRVRGGFIGSPIPDEEAKRMTDPQWIKAMHTYAKERSRDGEDFLKGGKHELARVLRVEAQIHKSRFAQLALRLEDTVAAEYFNAILSGITKTTQDIGERTLPASALDSLDTATIAQVIVRVNALGVLECARDICWAIQRVAKETLPAALIPVVCHYAMNDSDPEEEEWQDKSVGTPMWGGDPHFHGMNSVRGAASEALASILFSNHDYFAHVESAVLSVVHDRSIAVRSCALLSLVAMLNFDRDRAVQLFLELTEDADAVLGTQYSEQFIYHATYRHYGHIRSVLLRMLTATEKGTRSIASRQITLAAFHDPQAKDDVQRVLSGDEVCREAAAGIYAHNLGRVESRPVCAGQLAQLFDDEAPKVRASAASCFRLLPPKLLTQEQDLIFRFIESQACLDDSHDLIYALRECTDPLPEVTCRLPERLIAAQRAKEQGQNLEHRWWTHQLPAFVARLYEQAQDSRIKTRCLNIIDAMLELGFGEIEKELAQVER